jgi:hypothetical protein
VRAAVLIAIAAGSVVSACQSTRTQTTHYVFAPQYGPVQQIQTPPPDGPPSPAQIEARHRHITQGLSRNPEAWNHNGYHYDAWGNLIRVDPGVR